MTKSYLINADIQPTEGNKHSWLVLHGSEPRTAGPRIMTGTLRPVYRGFETSAVAFGRAKLQPVVPAADDLWAITAARSDVLLPAGADDRYACPRLLLEEADALVSGPTDPLLTYLTFTWTPARLHEMYEEVRSFLFEEIVGLGCPVLLVLHAPHRARSGNDPHCHALIVPTRLTSFGWAERTGRLTGDKGHRLVLDRFEAFRGRRTRAVAAA